MATNPLTQTLLEQAEGTKALEESWFAVLAKVPMNVLEEQRGAFFGSIFGTLNHVLTVDDLWVARVEGVPSRVKSFASLRDRVCQTMSEYVERQMASLDKIIGLIRNESDPTRFVKYVGLDDKPFGHKFYQCLNVMLTHHHHHLGQVSQMCHELKVEIPDGGLIAYYRTPPPWAKAIEKP